MAWAYCRKCKNLKTKLLYWKSGPFSPMPHTETYCNAPNRKGKIIKGKGARRKMRRLCRKYKPLKVLHDWDLVEVGGRWAIKRGIALLVYGLSKKVKALNLIKIIRESNLKIQGEKLDYMETLIKLNKLCGVDQIFGIGEGIKEIHGEAINAFASYGVDIRDHIHIGEYDDPNRVRKWIPPLRAQTKKSWRFDSAYANGEVLKLGPDERPIFHVDRPFELALYISYLFEEILSE